MAYPNKSKKYFKIVAIAIGAIVIVKFIYAKWQAHKAAAAVAAK